MSRLSLLERDWPEADRRLLADLLASGGPFDESGPLARLKPISRIGLVTAYGRWLAWLAREDPAALNEPPTDRATPERFRGWLASMGHLAPQSRHGWGSHALRVLSAARPEANWQAHLHMLHLLWRQVSDYRSTRKDGRIVSTAVLFGAARERYEAQGFGSAPADFQAVRVRRDAAMVAFLAVLPIRRRAFCGLEIGTSLLVSAAGQRVVLDADLTKTGHPWEAPVPAILAEVLADYLSHVRPQLARQESRFVQHLWLNEHGRPYQAIHLAACIRQITFDLIGVRVTPHFFRDCAATTLAYDSPDSARLSRGLLGHTSFRTAEQHYNQAKGVEAGRQYADLLSRLADKSS